MKYSKLVEVYENLEKTTKRLEKTKIISELFKNLNSNDLQHVVLLLQGKVFPSWDSRKIGVASKTILKAIHLATGVSVNKLEKEWIKKGDLGDVAYVFVRSKKQATLFSEKLTVKKVFSNIVKLPDIEGTGSIDRKISVIAELLTSAKPNEARYIVRTILEDMRFGVGEGSIRDCIVWAYFGDKLNIKYDEEKNELLINDEERKEYNSYIEVVQNAYDITNDFSIVAEVASKIGINGLKKVTLQVGRPIKVMLYQKAESFEDAFKIVGSPAAFEYKYDGMRMQIHRDKDKIMLFSRRQEDLTKQFPDVVKVVREKVKSKIFILDAEIIGIDKKSKKWLPFQNISQRIKRKYDIDKMAKEVPVMINFFDVIYEGKKNLLCEDFSKRREVLNKIVTEVPGKIQLASQIITDEVSKAEKFYNKALDLGNEGIMAKALDKPYKPGSRVGYGVKIKPVMETLDLVIVKAEWGEGKRANWLSSFTVACMDDDGNLLEIGKVGTGIKEKEEEGVSFSQLTKLLKPLILKKGEKEVSVKPEIVIEVNYEEIQKSVNYDSGFSLRFPRLVSLREDKSVKDVSGIDFVKELFKLQRKRG